MLDLVLKGGEVVDGTGSPRFRADVGVVGDRIVAVGRIDEAAKRTIDASGLVVAPGFVDIHTHYDTQVLWDGAATPSPYHGVTTVVGGNCGYSIAPMAAEHSDYLMRMMAKVEGIPIDSLRAGPAWDWHGFGEWLDRLEGTVSINCGFLVGHSTIRRLVMGADSVRKEATPEQVEEMVEIARQAMLAGALGFSSALGDHTDGDGAPVPSCLAGWDEILAICRAVRDCPGTTLQFIPAVREIWRDRAELMAKMSLEADRPLNWNLLGGLVPYEIYEDQLEASDLAERMGAYVVALTLPDLLRMRDGSLLQRIPGWAEVADAEPDQRARLLADPHVRARMIEGVKQVPEGPTSPNVNWSLVEIAESDDPADAGIVGRSIAELAAERGVSPAEILVDVVAPKMLPLTRNYPSLTPTLGATDESWRVRAGVWRDRRTVLGGADGGAHLDMMCHANYTTVVLGQAVRERQLLGLEEAVAQMTEVPARLYGITGRGRIEEGWFADVVVFDPDTIDSQPSRTLVDLPAAKPRVYAEAVGVRSVIVNGAEIVSNGALSDEKRPGTVLRSGRHTESVTPEDLRRGRDARVPK